MKYKARPRIVTWLTVGVLIFSILFIIRLVLSFGMPELPISIPEWYLSLTGAFWGLLGLIISYGFFLGQSWALRLLNWGSLCFMVWYWVDRLVLVQSDYGRSTWPAAVTITLIAQLLIVLSQRRTDVKTYFQEKT